jgi:hypothetical protein
LACSARSTKKAACLDGRRLAARLQPFQCVIADGLEHPETWPSLRLWGSAQEALLHQASDGGLGRYLADGLSSFEGEAAREDGQPPEDDLLGRCQQVVAPFNRVTQCALAGRQITRAASQSVERRAARRPAEMVPAGQPIESGPRRQQPRLAGSQLDGERKAVESRANLRYGSRILVG